MTICLAGILLAGFVALLPSDPGVVWPDATPFLVLLLFWSVLITAPYRGARRQLNTNASISEEIAFVFSSCGIHRKGAHFEGDMDYTLLWAVFETKSLFLLYLSAGSAFALPKRFFKDAGRQQAWRALLERQIAPKTIAKPDFFARLL